MTSHSHSPRNAQDLSISALLHPTPPEEDDVTKQIRNFLAYQFDDLLDNIPPRKDASDAGALVHMGEVCLHLQTRLSDIMGAFLRDEVVTERTVVALEEARHIPGHVSNIDALTNIHNCHKALRNIRAATQKHAHDLAAAWKRTPRSHARRKPDPATVWDPTAGKHRPLHESDRLDGGGHEVRPMYAVGTSPPDYHASPDSAGYAGSQGMRDDDFDMADVDMDALKNRGKGVYKCTYGKDCTKGGVDTLGNIVIFERNCMFRQHMDKHKKPYRCQLPGCPNRDGFARKDQLERHVKNVKHGKEP